jgi:hypothetical protein
MADEQKSGLGFFRVASDLVTQGALKTMTAVDLKVLLALAFHANWRTGRCWPSYRKLRELTGASMTSISGSIGRLVDLGAIVKMGKGKGRRAEYRVMRTLQSSPDKCSSRTERSQRNRKRGSKGRWVLQPHGIQVLQPLEQSAPAARNRTRVNNESNERDLKGPHP